MKTSILKRYIKLYILLLSLTVLVTCYISVKNTSSIIRSNLNQYNQITLNSIADLVHSQVKTLKSSSQAIYALRIDGVSICSYINRYFNTLNNPHELNPSAYSTLYNYFEFANKPLLHNTSYFFLADKNQRVAFSFSNKIISNNTITYTKQALKHIVFQTPKNIYEQVIYHLTPTQTHTPSSQTDSYIFYDFLRNPYDFTNYIGYIACAFDVSSIDKLIASNSEYKNGTTYIFSANNELLYCSDSKLYKSIFPYYEQATTMEKFSTKIDNNLLSVVKIDDYPYYVANITSTTKMYQKVLFNQLYTVLSAFFLLAIALLLIFISGKHLFHRINTIIRVITQNEPGKTPVFIPLTKRLDELDIISSSYNTSIKELDYYINKNLMNIIQSKEASIIQKEQELYILQSQINPHFLYNTLEMIRMKAVNYEQLELATLIQILSNIFRRRIKSALYLTISEDVNYYKDLLALYGMKYDGELDTTIDIDDRILELAILKDLLQPIIENIFVHAFKNCPDTLEKEISIMGYLSDKTIYFIIQDNGSGFDKEKLAELNASFHTSLTMKHHDAQEHIGLHNVNSRLQLIYKTGCGLHIESKPGNTKIFLHFPALEMEELNKLL